MQEQVKERNKQCMGQVVQEQTMEFHNYQMDAAVLSLSVMVQLLTMVV
jgi:hypothetical protein